MLHALPTGDANLRIDRPACGSTSVSWRSSPKMPTASQAVAGKLTLTPAGPARLAARTASRRRPGHVAAIMSACSRTPDLRSRSNPSSRSNGQTPTCTSPIWATVPWRTASDSIRARTPCSSMGLSNTAATLTTSDVAIAPSHQRRPRIRNVNIDARMPQPDLAAAVGRLRVAGDVDQVRFNPALRVDSGPSVPHRNFASCPVRMTSYTPITGIWSARVDATNR